MNKFEILESSGKKVELGIRNLLAEDWDEAEKIRAAKVARLFRQKGDNKLLSRVELAKYLEDNDIWTKKDEEKVIQLNKDIVELLEKLKNKNGKMTLAEGRKVCLQINDKRLEIIRVSEKRQYLDDVTMEAIAEQEKIDFLVYISTVYPDTGKNYWESFEDMKNDKNGPVFNLAYRNSIKNIYGYDPDYEKQLPENKWLVKYKFKNEEGYYTDRKTGQVVDRDGRTEEEIKKELESQITVLLGTVEEENPYIDDETNLPVVVEKSESKEDKPKDSESKPLEQPTEVTA